MRIMHIRFDPRRAYASDVTQHTYVNVQDLTFTPMAISGYWLSFSTDPSYLDPPGTPRYQWHFANHELLSAYVEEV